MCMYSICILCMILDSRWYKSICMYIARLDKIICSLAIIEHPLLYVFYTVEIRERYGGTRGSRISMYTYLVIIKY